jgi:hypothetical protein
MIVPSVNVSPTEGEVGNPIAAPVVPVVVACQMLLLLLLVSMTTPGKE